MGVYIHFGVPLKSAKELASDSMLDGDFVLKGGTITVVNKKSDSIINIHNWTAAFIIYMNILLEKWPSKAKEYLKYMHNIRLASSRSSNNGWVIYDEQLRSKRVCYPSSSWCLIDQELWILYVATNNSSCANNASHIRGLNIQTWNDNPRQFNSSFNSGDNLPSRGNFPFRAEGFQRLRQICFLFNQERCIFGKKMKI